MKYSIYFCFILMLQCAVNGQKVKQDPISDSLNATDSSQVGSAEFQKSYMAVAQLKYHNQVKYLFNSDTTYVLCINTPKPKHKQPKTLVPLRFFIYDLNSNEIVFEDSLENGRVDWESNAQIKVTWIPETVKRIQSTATGYTYHVLSRKKQSILKK